MNNFNNKIYYKVNINNNRYLEIYVFKKVLILKVLK